MVGLAAAGLLSGCGGSGDYYDELIALGWDPGPMSEAEARAFYEEKAERVCATYSETHEAEGAEAAEAAALRQIYGDQPESDLARSTLEVTLELRC